MKKVTFKKILSLHNLPLLAIYFALTACSGISGGGDSIGGFGHGVGEVGNLQGGGDESGGQAVGDGSTGQPTFPSIAKPAPGRFNVTVLIPSSAKIIHDINNDTLENPEMSAGSFPGAKPQVSLLYVGENTPSSTESTDESGNVQMRYSVRSFGGESCKDIFDVYACYFDGTNHYKSDSVRLECPHEGYPKLAQVTLTLQPSNVPVNCQAQIQALEGAIPGGHTVQ